MDLILSFPPRPRRKYCLMIWPKICLLFLSQYKTVWISRLGSELMVRRIDLKFTFYSTIYLCSRCIARYKLANMHARTTIWGAWNVRCTIVHTNMFWAAQKMCTKISNSWIPVHLWQHLFDNNAPAKHKINPHKKLARENYLFIFRRLQNIPCLSNTTLL